MKRVYIVPELEIIVMNGGKIMDMLTESIGEWGRDHPFDAKETSDDIFDTTDDLWDRTTHKDVWG